MGHLGTIMQLQFSPDGKTLLAMDARGGLKLWQVSHGEELLTWPSREAIQSFSLSPDGNGLAIARTSDIELLEIFPTLRQGEDSEK